MGHSRRRGRAELSEYVNGMDASARHILQLHAACLADHAQHDANRQAGAARIEIIGDHQPVMQASRMLLAPMFVVFLVGLFMVAAAPLYGQ